MTTTELKRGWPVTFTKEIADQICARMASGESLRSICFDENMPPESTVRLWAVDDREGFAAQYARAREALVEYWADDIVEIADESSNDTIVTESGVRADSEWINRSRLRVDTRKWLMSKLAPKKYGDRQSIEHAGKDGGPIEIATDADRVRALKAFLAKGRSE